MYSNERNDQGYLDENADKEFYIVPTKSQKKKDEKTEERLFVRSEPRIF